MPWYKNTRTGHVWDISTPEGIEAAEVNSDLVKVDGPNSEEPQAVDIAPEQNESNGDTEDALEGLSKDELKDLAKSLGIAVSGKNVEQLRAAIKEA